MSYALTILGAGLACVALSSCNKPQAATESRDPRVSQMAGEIEDLRAELAEQQNSLAATNRYLISVGRSLVEARENHTALLKIVNSNATVANKQSNAYHTRMGDCGKEWLESDQGTVSVNRDCGKVQR